MKAGTNRRDFFSRTGAAALALAVCVLGLPASAAEDRIFTGLVDGVAVGGYDAVAYFKQNKPVRGKAEITAEFGGVTWRFASTDNRDAFVGDPKRYAPQYGGYCSWAVANGYTAKGDPNAWRIVDGKLYLNYSKGVQRRWAKDIPGNISKAEANWPDVLN